ncbi:MULTISPECIES: hypothetical protein [Mycobacterium]|uniref:Uncharacterized protein n=1 Tax=Mycobacterium kiyosense TaxID=2871094 RepID=A0A9P3UZC4_9MYCO|nr:MULTISPECIES: hypothetical protein [Mycobacterium]BDB44634.1 hypothetical protein IWGMT90018_50800 [Mycobacterium kiyosense]BDE16136.1 hypothetical protein MKCMC460_49960 [Mycobacterium sp. 20KCMC460]GLB82192.1 hypothetical protein SRL2020028_14480 [Mycobacterium kiyosense]GLB91639.1 hypothetical protein SRL2020130_44560 [Mycobacterium kiyosense]GLB95335.1 hypothetical protein SRL2020226_21110 [Mycobacterium kiyosense]
MGMLFGFAPWIVYWVLVGNVPFATAVSIALLMAVCVFAVGRAGGKPAQSLEIGGVATFAVLAVLAFSASDAFLARWIEPLSNAGIFLVTLVGVLIGKPFVREYAAAEQPADVVSTELFRRTTSILTWVWVAAFGGMTVASAIPPILQGNATLLDTKTPTSFVFYWVIPFALLGVAALMSRYLPERMLAGIDDVARETSFVAYDEATIDELYYLAQEHANREVGPGKEAYNVKVGGMGTPLTGDESRKSWPSTYKVRDKKR